MNIMTRFIVASLVASAALASAGTAGAFDEAGVIQITGLNDTKSTAMDCMGAKAAANASTKHYFAIARNGDTTFMSTYPGTYNRASNYMNATISDTANASLTSAGDKLELDIRTANGTCAYMATVAAGSVLGIKSDVSVVEAGVVNVTDLDTRSTLGSDQCKIAGDDLQDTYAYVRTQNMTVLGGYWGMPEDGYTHLTRTINGTTRAYDILAAKNGTITLSTTSTAGGMGERMPSGCVFKATVVNGTVNGVTPTMTHAHSLRGSADKVVCRMVCNPPFGCRSVCRDVWRA